MTKAVVILLLVGVASGELLPEFMVGDFKLETSEGFTDFMYELGVDWFKRSIACTLYPLQKISQDPATEEISMDTITTFKSTYTKFKLNEPWEEYTGDGRTTTTVTSVDGRKLVKVQTPDPSTGYHSTTEVRDFSEDGELMTMTMWVNDKPEIKSVRVYRRKE